ncbi:N-acetylmuramoyl-L-alanine amidase family protein [Nafulsella turpanensis]|uniref:N-acetylmuramoyl-L-alanine amidase family protein n=1 Tax=Nafulsella turpanensis TaxID=1265690 RepID=UPI000346BCB5|nr:N-acetylmuramoyl-L-alanine amidase [Nafulsella turpanensis]
MRNIVSVCGFSLLILLCAFTPVGKVEYKIRTVVIDAGHGGKDPGTHGVISEEKDVALDIALEVGSIIQQYLPDVKVIYTRKDDTFVELEERANIANEAGADVFISIHCNAIGREDVYGTETYIMGTHVSDRNLQVAQRENAVILMEDNYEQKYEGFDPESPESYIMFSLMQNAFMENSLRLAYNVEHQFEERVGRHSRGVKQAGFVVLWRTTMPSILVEVGYLTNKKEERFLNDDLGQTYIASGIFRAFRDYKVEIESMN